MLSVPSLLISIFFSLAVWASPSLEELSLDNVNRDIKKLEAIDLNSDDVVFGLLGDLQGRSIIIRIQDKQGNTLGVFKPDSGSTLQRGEIASFRLARAIGFYAYSASEPMEISVPGQRKILSLLESKRYDKDHGERFREDMETKERNRKIMVDELKYNIERAYKLKGAYKPWFNNIHFYLPLGTVSNLKKHKVYNYLKHSDRKVPHEKLNLRQCTRIFKPRGCVSAYAYLDELTRDISSIILLDSVLGNRDRFPGGNLHIRALSDSDVESKNGDRNFKRVRLFSLDNGAVLTPGDKTGFNILKDLSVSRFVKEHVQGLRTLSEKSDKSLRAKLGLSAEELQTLRSNLKRTLDYIALLEEEHGDKVWFN